MRALVIAVYIGISGAALAQPAPKPDAKDYALAAAVGQRNETLNREILCRADVGVLNEELVRNRQEIEALKKRIDELRSHDALEGIQD